MAPVLLPTRFLSAERATLEEVRRQHDTVGADLLARGFLDAMPNMVLMLNEHRQVFFANSVAVDELGVGLDGLLGKRPGEVMGCLHASEEYGCGTTEFCTTCGVANGVACAVRGKADSQECRIQVESPNPDLDLRVWATPFRHEGFAFTLFAVVDISHEKRRRALERAFFHDVLNSAGGVMGLAQLISESEPSASVELIGLLKPCAAQLMDEIVAQRDLAAVESGEYYPGPVSCPLKALLETTAGLCAAHEVGRGRTVVVEPGVPTDSIVTERSLLTRVIGNMIKNALEAEPVGAVVKVGAERLEGGLYTLWVRNPTVMPRHVQLQIFQRSFTTKGSGRGLGTYSMKLLAERFLNGKVSFTSVAGTGTEFRITIPASTDV